MPSKQSASKRVVGIGGVFFKSAEPKKLSDWYAKHLGLKIQNNVALFTWTARKNPKKMGYTVWSIFPGDSNYFGAEKTKFMVNYRVKDLPGLLKQLRKEKVRVAKRMEESPYGKFAWIMDPDGNRIELWQPPASYKAPEEEIASE